MLFKGQVKNHSWEDLRRRRGGGGGSSSLVDIGLFSVFSCHDDMPMVLHSIICSAREKPCNHCPFVAIQSVSRQQPLLFFLTECPSVDPWI